MKRKQKKKLESKILKMVNKSSSQITFKEIGDRLYLSKKKDLKILKKKLVSEKEIKDRINQFKKAKKTKKTQECVVKGPTGRWIQIKDTVTPSGNILPLMTNVTKIIEQEKIVDLVVGPDAYRDLPNLLKEVDDGRKAINVLLSKEETYADLNPVRLDKNGITAFVSIMRGCNNL